MVKKTTGVPVGIVDALKKKLIDFGVDYFKKNIDKSKKEIIKYLERNIERKIKKEIKKATGKILSGVILLIGGFFLLYGLLATLVYFLQLPSFVTSVTFGIILIIAGTVIYLKSL